MCTLNLCMWQKDNFIVLIARFHVNLLGPDISNGLVTPLLVVCKWEVYHNFVLRRALVYNGYGYASIITLKIDMVLRHTNKRMGSSSLPWFQCLTFLMATTIAAIGNQTLLHSFVPLMHPRRLEIWEHRERWVTQYT